MNNSFELARVLYEARIKEAWGTLADYRLKKYPYPSHIGEERSAEVDLAIAQAKELLKLYTLTENT